MKQSRTRLRIGFCNQESTTFGDWWTGYENGKCWEFEALH